jgi:ABC-type Na+ efflux pump permease subunit
MAYVHQSRQIGADLVLGMISPDGFAFVAIGVVTLLLVNAQAVTALTSERDTKTLELLLVTDISAKEFIYGKLGGVLYNTKELILLPLAGLIFYAVEGTLVGESFVFVTLGYLLLVCFAAMLGMHAGLSFDNSRSAIANSLGTMFFLFLGVFICMLLIVEARSSFMQQMFSFLVFILGGSMGLWASLTHKNPSPALTLSAFFLPFLTFYAITCFVLGESLSVWGSLSVAYGFTLIAMLIPAVSEFDVALGRTTLDKG